VGRELSLSGTIPASDLNGWNEMIDDLVKDPTKQRVAVVVFDVQSIKRNVDKGTDMPIVRLRAIEPLTDETRSKEMRLVMSDIYAERTGKDELDLDYSEDGDEG